MNETQPAVLCSTCTHWLPRDDRQFGKCRRYPPAILGRNESTFPATSAETWCGEWKQSFEPAPEPPKKSLADRVEPTGPVTASAVPPGVQKVDAATVVIDQPPVRPALPQPAGTVPIAPATGQPPQPAGARTAKTAKTP